MPGSSSLVCSGPDRAGRPMDGHAPVGPRTSHENQNDASKQWKCSIA